jgi:hypothetical protein
MKSRETREGGASPIKKTGKAVALMSKPRRALQIKSGEKMGIQSEGKAGAGETDSGKAKGAMISAGDENAPALRLAKNRTDINKDKLRQTVSVNPKSKTQPLMPRTKASSSKRLFEVLSGPSSPTRSTTPLPDTIVDATDIAVAGPSSGPSARAQTSLRMVTATSTRTGKSPAKKSRAESQATVTLATSSAITRTPLGAGRISSISAATSAARAALTTARPKPKSKLFDIYTDDREEVETEPASARTEVGQDIEDKENADPAITSRTLLDSPASRTRSKTRTSLSNPRTADQGLSPSASRSRARVSTTTKSSSAAKAILGDGRQALGDVFVLGDVSEAYGAVGAEPEGFKVCPQPTSSLAN